MFSLVQDFLGLKKRVRIRHGKQAINIRVIEVYCIGSGYYELFGMLLIRLDTYFLFMIDHLISAQESN